MIDRVVWEIRHKFVYYDDESINLLRELEGVYPFKIDSEEPIVVYIKDSGLPKLDTKFVLSKDIVKIFHEHYYQLLIFSEIINNISNKIEEEELNNRLGRIFKLCSCMGREKIKDIATLKRLLVESRKMYVEAYLDYMKNEKTDFYDRVPIPFVMIDNVIIALKEKLGSKKYFCIMLELDEDISIYNCMAINDYIASRCNGYLSMNVLLHSDSEWKFYYANNGQFIQDVHDYTEVDLRKHKIRKKDIQ